MTTEGDGNYQLQRFLESEGAEVDIQGITNWLLSTCGRPVRHEAREWSSRRRRGPAGLEGKDAGTKVALRWAPTTRSAAVSACTRAPSAWGYHLPDMDAIATISHQYYDNDVRGGEGHMEVGKLIHSRRPREATWCQRQAVRLHAVVGRVRRHAVARHGRYPDAIFTRDRNDRRRRGQRAEPHPDGSVQGPEARRGGIQSAIAPPGWAGDRVVMLARKGRASTTRRTSWQARPPIRSSSWRA